MPVRRLTDRELDRLYRRYEDAHREYQRLSGASYGSPRWKERVRAERRMHRLEQQLRSHGRRRRGSPARDRAARSPTAAQERVIGRKIRRLRREGYPEKQAIAIAYRYAGVAPRKRA